MEEKNSSYFFNLEKWRQAKKKIQKLSRGLQLIQDSRPSKLGKKYSFTETFISQTI